eukprot:12925222-Prorocentrum_lima.AAC.1
MRGGPKGLIHMSCSHCKTECAVRSFTIRAWVKRVHVSITCGHGSFLPTRNGAAEDAGVPCSP